MKRAALASLIVLAALLLGTAAAARPPDVTPAELAAQLESDAPPIVLDVRTLREWNEGHIPGAMHIPIDEMNDRKHTVPQDRDVVVHCGVAPRARMAEKMLMRIGHERVFHLDGGFNAWKAAELPVETPAAD